MKTATLIAIVLAAVQIPAAWAQSSTTFVMERACFGGGGQTLVSTNLQNIVVLGSAMPSGTAWSCAGGVLTNIGFCLVAEEIPVPLVLDVMHNAADPAAVDVIWNGASALYQLYRDFDPVAVVVPGNLYAETAECQVTDGGAAGQDIVFYNVVPRP